MPFVVSHASAASLDRGGGGRAGNAAGGMRGGGTSAISVRRGSDTEASCRLRVYLQHVVADTAQGQLDVRAPASADALQALSCTGLCWPGSSSAYAPARCAIRAESVLGRSFLRRLGHARWGIGGMRSRGNRAPHRPDEGDCRGRHRRSRGAAFRRLQDRAHAIERIQPLVGASTSRSSTASVGQKATVPLTSIPWPA